jgi:hydrogenase maturation protease
MAARSILVGLGNPLMSDDVVGLIVAGEVHKRLSGFDLELSSSDGLDVVDRILDHDFAVIIDSMVTGEHRPGTAVRLGFQRSMRTLRASDVHGVGFSQAIELARSCGATVPSRIVVYGIEVVDPHSVGNLVSAVVSQRIDAIVDEIARDLPEASGSRQAREEV